MSRDVLKFIRNRVTLAEILGDVRITRWILFAPEFDSKEIVKHAAKKTKEILASNLPYVDNENFRVMVEHEEAFAVERDALLRADLSEITVLTDELPENEISDWADVNDEFVKIADDKVSLLPTLHSRAERLDFRNQIIRRHLEGQNTLEELRKYPAAYEAIRRAKSEREKYLWSKGALAEGNPAHIFQSALDDIQQVVEKKVRGVCLHTVTAVAWEAVSDWLLRCPLNFPRRSNHA